MPLYQYQSVHPEDFKRSCAICRPVFELRRTLDRSDTLNCPTCQNPVRKVPALPFTPSHPSPTRAKAAGFTTFKNQGNGLFEQE